MNVLVLGATSHIGSALAESFAAGNCLILTGRNKEELNRVAYRCRAKGAEDVRGIACDLSSGFDSVLSAIAAESIDLVVNVCSATSRLHDREIDMGLLPQYVSVDLLTPVELIRQIRVRAVQRSLAIICVSTILAVLKSPDRIIYGCLKALQERSLQILACSFADTRLMVVRVAQAITVDRRTRTADALAAHTKKAFSTGEAEITFGAWGKAMRIVFYIQPVLFNGLMAMFRSLARRKSRPAFTVPDAAALSRK
jgi:NAD(P)-dependent dehydrogenase (short-subunit alcohol dehydrogenase family)